MKFKKQQKQSDAFKYTRFCNYKLQHVPNLDFIFSVIHCKLANVTMIKHWTKTVVDDKYYTC